MGMPNNLVLVRHGESEGNIASARSKAGDHSDFQGEFMNRHSSKWRLSPEGVRQAQATRDWLKQNIPYAFDKFYVSEYVRAMETAAHLELPEARWFAEFYLRERNWGDLDRMSVEERKKRFAESLKEREIDPFFWQPPNGESMATVCLRLEKIFETLHRECDGKNVIIVCHGEVMWGFRVRLERMTQEHFYNLDTSKNPIHRIHNCQIIHYTRIDPTSPPGSSASPYLGWMRSVCPWNEKLSAPGWHPIYRPRFTNEELLGRVEKIKPIIV